jgi:hypothetical protein
MENLSESRTAISRFEATKLLPAAKDKQQFDYMDFLKTLGVMFRRRWNVSVR